MTDWSAEARVYTDMGLGVFPIAIAWDGTKQKWTKRPLTPNGHHGATLDVADHNWSGANGFGIAMGDGWYCLDVDDYKDASEARAWLKAWDITLKTRVHETVSGGMHLVYRLPEEYRNLRSRQNIVRGLDARGDGGWIAFGEGYAVYDAREPWFLVPRVCRFIDNGRDATGGPLGALEAFDRGSVDLDLLQRRVDLRRETHTPLAKRWQGWTEGLTDTSRSGMDMSVAQHLAICDFGYDDIVATLLYLFPYGQARWAGKPEQGERWAKRCATKALAYQEEQKRLMSDALNRQSDKMTEEQERELRKRLTHG